MEAFSINEMQEMQRNLQEKYKDKRKSGLRLSRKKILKKIKKVLDIFPDIM